MQLLTLNECGLVTGGLTKARGAKPAGGTTSSGRVQPFMLPPGGVYSGGYSGYLGGIDPFYGSYGGDSYGGYVKFSSSYGDTSVQSGDKIIVGSDNHATMYYKSAEIASGTLEVSAGIAEVEEGAALTLGSGGALTMPGAIFFLTGVVDIGIGLIELHKATNPDAVTQSGNAGSIQNDGMQHYTHDGTHLAAA